VIGRPPDPTANTAVGRSSPLFMRRSTVGCLVALAVLLVVATVGITVLDRGIRWTVSRAVERLQAAVPDDLAESRREELETALGRFEVRVETHDDANPLIGRFLGMVSEMLDDRRLTEEELRTLEEFLAAVEAAGGLPQDSAPPGADDDAETGPP